MIPNEIKIKGGARFGLVQNKNGVNLTVDKNKLEINAGIIGKVVFMPSDIVAIEADRSGIVLSGPGIVICHNVAGYRKKIIFYPRGQAADTLKAIYNAGFLNNTGAIPYDVKEEIELLQTGGSFAIKTPAAIAVIVIWNICCLYGFKDFFTTGKYNPVTGIGAGLATGFVFTLCIGLLTLKPVRQLVLKPGRKVDEFKWSLYFLMALMAIIFAFNTGLIRALAASHLK